MNDNKQHYISYQNKTKTRNHIHHIMYINKGASRVNLSSKIINKLNTSVRVYVLPEMHTKRKKPYIQT